MLTILAAATVSIIYSHTMLVVILMWHTLRENSAQIGVYCCSSQEPMAASLWGMECVLI